MKIAILQTGAAPTSLQPLFGDYPAMLGRLLAGDCAPCAVFKIQDGQFPHEIEDFDGYVLTGSSAGVYDDLPWIAPLKRFVQNAKGRAALVGICFGHQIMAEAFGGAVVKSPKGSGIGLHSYAVKSRTGWSEPVSSIAIPASHQDQVVLAPPTTRILAASSFTPFAALAYQDQPAISFQGHPEFTPDYAKALIEGRRGVRYTQAEADAAIVTLDRPNDCVRVGGWIGQFLTQAAASAGLSSRTA